MTWKHTMAVLAVLLASTISPALAGRRSRDPQLRLGRPRLIAQNVVAVPVKLRVGRGQEVVGLNFTLHYDATRFELADPGVREGPTVRRARAQLASRDDAAAGTTKVIVVPEFAPEFTTIQGHRVATVYLRLRGARPRSLKRSVKRGTWLEDVVLADRDGHELRVEPQAQRGGR